MITQFGFGPDKIYIKVDDRMVSLTEREARCLRDNLSIMLELIAKNGGGIGKKV